MQRWLIVAVVHEHTPAVEDWLAAVNRISTSDSAVPYSYAARPISEKRGEGDFIWDLVVDDDRDPLSFPQVKQLVDDAASAISASVTVPLTPIASRRVRFAGPRAKRTLLMRVRPGTSRARVETLERSLCAMSRHIETIRGWALSRVEPAMTPHGWTHVWEQEFPDKTGFRPYMASTYHWTGVERWFDSEIPQSAVDDEAHFICEIPGPVPGLGL